jgi:malonate transporter and related proteins
MINVREVTFLSTLKLIANPVLMFALAGYVFQMDPMWSQAAIIRSAMPSGANAYVIAQQDIVHVETASAVCLPASAVPVANLTMPNATAGALLVNGHHYVWYHSRGHHYGWWRGYHHGWWH